MGILGEGMESTSSSLSEGLTHHESGSDAPRNSSRNSATTTTATARAPSSPNSSTRKACYAVLQSWVSKKFMTGCVVLFPLAVTFLVTWWFIQFVDGFFSPIYAQLFGFDVFGLGFLTSLDLAFIFFVGVFASSWLGASVFWIGEWFIKRMPFVKHIYSASKQISSAISPDQNTTAFKEVAIIRHPRHGEYAFGFITSSVLLQKEDGDEELCSVYVPTNHLYIGDIFLVSSEEIIRPNLSIREGIEIIVSVGMTMPQALSPVQSIPHQSNRIPMDSFV
ncbi:Protein LIKE COV 2 [Turnera subulata]|uniref:Protein LIKE COV 2 n=1 Tax=Turnera subulata TaxID=218843 RepID=A0A9Q0J134_9ROSI|nr:Protein LIKE COV 2 [Turnera subulata]